MDYTTTYAKPAPQSPAGHPRPNKNQSRTYMLISLTVLGTAWCLITYIIGINPVFLPSPTSVANAFLSLGNENVLLPYTLISLYRVLVGFLAAALLAIPLGILMATSPKVEGFFAPFIGFIRYLPVSALIPLMILYFGIGDFEKMAVIFVGSFFQLVLMVQDTVATVPGDLLKAAYTLGASGPSLYTRVILPASLPGIMDNLRICMGWAWTYLVIAELVAANSGLGFMILRSQRFLQTDRIFAGLIIIGCLGVLTDYLFKFASKFMFPWHERLGH
ncbi:MAG TPA: ABC transporter permease [Syntrophomonas sp.]|nr:ABC transporter permease [Syntrophomonas sp.]